jgi:putative transcriptional regulator
VPTKLDPQVRQLARQIGEEIRTAREAAGLSQQALAESVGMSRTNFARIEYGMTNVTIETLLRISRGLELRLLVSLGPEPSRSAGRSRRRA